MPPPRKPSRVDLITFPVFACCWHGVPDIPNAGISGSSILAYCGGGGSARTGVSNSVAVVVMERVGPGEGDVLTRRIRVDTGDQIGVGAAMHRSHDGRGDGRMLVAVGDEVRMYAIPLGSDSDAGMRLPDDEGDDAGGVLFMGGVKAGDGYGCNAVAFSPLGDAAAVGCENGKVLMYRIISDSRNPAAARMVMLERSAECAGHDAAVCSVSFHPRGSAVLTSGKDGTARLWDAESGGELFRLRCSVEPIDSPSAGAAGAPKPKKGARPQKVLVRGCAFGDLEGKRIYTVASGRRGKAYLSRWGLVRTGPAPPPQRPNPDGTMPPFRPPPQEFREDARVECSDVPVSALSMSGDASRLALGGVDGTVSLLELDGLTVERRFPEVHDLPVTCVAARPVAREQTLPGDEAEGVNFDCISASADNRLARLTTQRRARRRPKKGPPKGKGQRGGGGVALLLLQLCLLALLYFVCRLSWELCRSELTSLVPPHRGGGPGEVLGDAYECVLHTVLWAPEGRPGISVPPH